MRKDPNNELSYNMEGAVNGGTFAALVERLTAHDQPVDPEFASSFLMTFHLFGTSLELFEQLSGRFSIQQPPGLTSDEELVWMEKKVVPIQVRVCTAFKLWIESFWIEKFDDDCLDDIHAFISGPVALQHPAPAHRILELLSKRVNSDVLGTKLNISKPKRIFRPEEYQQPILPKSLKKFVLFDLDPLEVARQLTLIEMATYSKIVPVELMKQEWSRKVTNSVAVNVREMTAMSNKITAWVVATILAEVDTKRRAYVLKYFIKIAEVFV